MHKLLYILLICVFSQTAQAQIYKCKSAQGKTIYSESPCEGMQSRPLEIIDNSTNSAHLRREAQRLRTSTNQQVDGVTVTTTTVSKTRTDNLMSDHDKQKRIAENKISYKAMTASIEKKNDALYENTILQKSQVKALSYDDNQRRSNLKVDLDNMDSAKRRHAAAELRSLYLKY